MRHGLKCYIGCVLLVALVISCASSTPSATMLNPPTALPSTTLPLRSALTVDTPAPTASPTQPGLFPSPTFTALSPQSPLLTPTALPTPMRVFPLVALDAGHGGRDLGARHFDADGHMDYAEAEVNLDLVLRVAEKLEARGFRVYLVRAGDYALNEPRVDVNDNDIIDFVDESQARVDAINTIGADLLLSIHQNAFFGADGEPAQDVGGTVTYYCADRPFGADNIRFAQAIQKHLLAAFAEVGYQARDRGVMDDLVLQVEGEPGSHLILLGPEAKRIARPSEMPGALSETLFITHDREGELARDPKVLDRLAEGYAQAISEFFEGVDASQP